MISFNAHTLPPKFVVRIIKQSILYKREPNNRKYVIQLYNPIKFLQTTYNYPSNDDNSNRIYDCLLYCKNNNVDELSRRIIGENNGLKWADVHMSTVSNHETVNFKYIGNK